MKAYIMKKELSSNITKNLIMASLLINGYKIVDFAKTYNFNIHTTRRVIDRLGRNLPMHGKKSEEIVRRLLECM
ncbi:MAG: hypothetical protein DRI57_33520 [Deltaproteobacteria bacterium]|nr:MAG: hypothetical protein DRI57_33520 [Deltaproteobacteria bacterium]